MRSIEQHIVHAKAPDCLDRLLVSNSKIKKVRRHEMSAVTMFQPSDRWVLREDCWLIAQMHEANAAVDRGRIVACNALCERFCEQAIANSNDGHQSARSEERRVGEECRSRG